MAVYELAYTLGRPVNHVLFEMAYEEFLKWQRYFELRPVGWREDDRTMKLLQAQGVKATPGEIFVSLKALQRGLEGADVKATMTVEELKQSSLFSKLAGAKGGINPFSQG
jgi:hypothetical protein